MDIKILGIKSQDKNYKNIEQEYIDRISHYSTISYTDKKEQKDSYVIKIGYKNKITSIDFAKKMSDILANGYSKIFFAFDIEEYNYEMSLVDMNVTDNMKNVLLLEQIYRTFKINNNETYHK